MSDEFCSFQVKYQAFQTGAGGRVRWSERGGSLASAANLQTGATSAEHRRGTSRVRCSHSLADVSSERHQTGATVAATSSAVKSRLEVGPAAADTRVETSAAAAASQATVEEGNARQKIGGEKQNVGGEKQNVGGEKLREVSLIWSALMERQRQRMDQLTVSPLPGIAEESESRKSSIRSSIDLSEVVGRAAAPAAETAGRSGRYNMAYSPD